MTITVLPMDATAGAPAYSAKNARQAQAPLYGATNGGVFSSRSGWRVGTPAGVVSVTSTQWTLNPSACMIAPAASLYQGMYGWASDQVITGAVTAADGTNPRLDILYIQVNDSSAGDGSGGLSAPVSYLAGTAAGTPVAPTLPPRSFLVATINVPKSGAGAPTITLNAQYFVAAGGILPVASQAERDALTTSEGLTVERTDLGGILQTYSSGGWHSTMAYDFGNGSAPGYLKSGTVVVNTDANGFAGFVFPTAFPSVMTSCNVNECTLHTTFGAIIVKYSFDDSDKTRFRVYLYAANGAAVANATGVRLSYIATGY